MAAASVSDVLQLSPILEAAEPPEARGLPRDGVRLLISDIARGSIDHARFGDLPNWLSEGDLLVVNTSATLNAALPARVQEDDGFELHVSTRLPGGFWTVELRRRGPVASLPYRSARSGLTLQLPAGASATLLAPYPVRRGVDEESRLWLAALRVEGDLHEYLRRHGVPIRYGYVPRPWPSSFYQTMFAGEPGSAEMPSAGRPFTPELVAALVARGVQLAPLLLHTGVASLEDHEPPYEEYYRVPAGTAASVNDARRRGRRIVAVGTTVVRALETVTDESGTTHPGEGWTGLVISADRGLRAVDSLVTGLHDPRATHLAMLERVFDRSDPRQGARQLQHAYLAARERGYLWHEFGDAHLILGIPRRPPDRRAG